MPVGTVPIAARIPADMAQALALACERYERSLSGELRLAIRRHLEELEREEWAASLTREQLDEYLAAAGIVDGREEDRAQARAENNDERPGSSTTAGRRHDPAVGAAEHGLAT